MAKKQATIKAGLFAKTGAPTQTPTTTATLPTPQADQAEAFDPSDKRRKSDDAKVKPVSVSLTVGEYDDIDAIAASVSATRMAIMNAAIRHTLAIFHAGKVQLKPDTKAGRVIVRFE